MRDPDQPETADDRSAENDGYAVIHLTREDAGIRAEHLERERRLGRRLQVEVSIDATGWLKTEIEIVVHKESDGTLRPIKVRVGANATDEAVLERGGIVAECARYNGALARLRQLAERLATLVRAGSVRLDPGSSLEYAHAQLVRLDELIAYRQQLTIGHRTIRASTIRREIEFFARCDAHLAPIILAAQPAVSGRPAREPPVATARWRRLWNRGQRRRS